MRKPELVLLMLFIALIGKSTFAQNPNFKLQNKDEKEITINQSFSESTEIKPFKAPKKIFGLAATADIEFTSGNGWVRLIMLDENFNEHLLLESYPNLTGVNQISLSDYAEETILLNGVTPYAINVEVSDANISLKSLSYSSKGDVISDYNKQKKEKRSAQNQDKIEKLNKNLKARGQHWVAGETSVSQLSYGERKKLYGSSTFPAGFEFYAGGVYSTSTIEDGSSTSLKSATASSPYISEWDWRDRHGKNWISPITNQYYCGSCWSFAAAGATEAIVNLFYNNILNLDLSEQDLISCSGAGGCDGGIPARALDYITNSGIIDEATFPYYASDLSCTEKGNTPNEKIKISGKIQFGSTDYPKSEDNLKDMLITYGPLSGALSDWSHAMPIVGYKVVESGDQFFYRDLNLDRYWITIGDSDELIGKTVWIFKNSWGDSFGDNGYVFVETPITNIAATYALKTPVVSEIQTYEVQCTDNDGDGYYFWGLGPKPANCPDCPDLADGDDSDPTKGPLDEYGYCMQLDAAPVPVANFTSTSTVINKGQSVEFTDLSTNTPTSWNWTFAGGTPATSTQQYPSVTYNTTGTFDVSLTVTNANGEDTKTTIGYITVSEPIVAPTASFLATPATINEGSEVSFNDLTTNEPTSWNWTFEGGTPATSNAQNPKVIYTTPGFYDVTLSVSNAGGTNTNTITNCIEVIDTVEAPLAAFSANNTTVSEGQTVQFTDQSINTPTSWSWTFSGGSPATSTEQNPSILYSAPGVYNVVLTVTNEGGSNTISKSSYITVQSKIETPAPVANFTSDVTLVDEGQQINFTDLSTNEPTTWDWTFEGGTPANSTSRNPSVIYATPGLYNVTLTASNDGGLNTITKSGYVTVLDTLEAPIADFTADNTVVIEGGEISFTDKSKNTPVSWQWEFEGGNPSVSTEKNPKVTYSSPSSYKVSLTVTNQAGNNTKVVENFISVEAAPDPEYCTTSPISTDEWIAEVHMGDNSNISASEGYADFTGTTFNFEKGSSINFTLVPGFSSKSKFEYWGIWIDFNSDMNFTEDEKVFSSNKSKLSVSGTITFPNELITTRMRVAMGKLPPSACDYADLGEVEDYTVVISEPVPLPPVADFTANATAIGIGQSVVFTNQSVNTPDSYQWYFPGGTPSASTAENPTITYPASGVYDVTLIAYKNGFSASEKTVTAYVTVSENDQTPTPADYCEPQLISSSLYYIKRVSVGNALTVNSFGDGYSFDTNPADLNAGGSYPIELVPSKTTSRNFWRIWIDFNNDGDFDDADETLLTLNNKKGTITDNITIPAYAAGTTRMRVAMKIGSSPSTCDDDFMGEVEDYLISFAPQMMQSSMAQASSSSYNEVAVNVYPNPTENILNLQLYGFAPQASYAIYNAVGEKVKEQQIDSPLTTVNLADRAPGMYIVVVTTEEVIFKEKIVKR